MNDLDFTILCEGAPWPYEPLERNGTRIEASFDDPVANVVFGCDVSAATRTERRQMFSRPLEVGVLLQPTFAWWTIQTSHLTFDAPFSAAVNGRAWADRFLATTSCGLCVAFVSDDVVRRLRMLSVPPSLWTRVMTALSACPSEQDETYLSLDIAAAQAMFSPAQVHRHAALLARSQG